MRGHRQRISASQRLPGRTGGQGNGVRTTYSLTEGKRRGVTLGGLNEMRRKQVGDPGRGEVKEPGRIIVDEKERRKEF